LEAGAVELFRALARALSASGVSDDAIRDALRRVRADVGQRALAKARRGDEAAVRAAGARILSTWCNSPEYTDQHGHPRPLPEKGDVPSISALIKAVVPPALRPRVKTLLRDSPSIHRAPDGTWTLLRGAVLIYEGETAVSRLTDLLEGLVRSIGANLTGGPHRMFECSASVESIPFGLLDQFSQTVDHRLKPTVDDLNTWLERARSERTRRGRHREIGFAAFTYALPNR
jgi:hypothetical protein